MLNILPFKRKTHAGCSDESLMTAYAKGDSHAFETLYARHNDSVYRFVLNQVSDTEQAHELFQDIWSKVIKNKTQYVAHKNNAGFKTWLFTLVRHTVVDFYRSQGRIKQWQEQLELDEVAIPTSDIPEPESRFEQHVLAEHLLSAIHALPELQREAFLLKEEAGLSLANIAHATDTTQETVKSRLRYAYKKLRTHLQGVRDE